MKWQGATLVKQSMAITYSPEYGYTFEPVHAGSRSAVAALAREYRAARIPHQIIPDGPKSTIQAQHQLPDNGEQETPNGSWALIGSNQSIDIRQHYKFLALSEYERGFISDKINGVTNFSPTEAAAMHMAGDALEFYKMAYNGQQHFQTTSWVLRHNLTVSQSYTEPLSGSNIGYIYTRAQLLAECASFGEDSLSPLMVSEIEAIPPIDLSPSPGYIEGWLKQNPTIQSTAGSRVECSVEYVLEIWPTLLYPTL